MINETIEQITGTLYARESTRKAPDGRKLVMLFGVVALPDGVEIEVEKMHVVMGHSDGCEIALTLSNPHDAEFDLTRYRAGQILTAGVWRV